MSYKLENTDYLYDQKIYVRSRTNPGDTDPGHVQVENSLLNILRHCTDLSTGSEELQKHISGWSSLYHLSPKRADVLRPFADQLRNKKALEIGSGCGTITRFLGELGCSVLALEGNIQSAVITAERCRDMENVLVVNDNLAGFSLNEKFDFIILIGSLEYGNETIGNHESEAAIEKLKEFLTPGGKMIIAVENKMGLKYWTGAPRDYERKSDQGIQNLYQNEKPKAFGHHEIISLLKKTGFGISECMYPFPDYKFADVIITDTGFKNRNFNATELLLEKFEYFQDTRYNNQFSSTLAALSLSDNNLLPFFSNSFLIAATLSEIKDSIDQGPILAYVYSTSRKKQYCKKTIFTYHSNTEVISVTRQLLYENNGESSPDVQQVLHDEPYIRGEVLLSTLLPIVSATGWTTEDIAAWASGCYEVIISKSFSEDGQVLLEGKYLDLTPFNIILTGEQPRFFDLEWVCYENIPAYYVFFRGLVHSLSRLLFVSNPGAETPLQIIQLAKNITGRFFDFNDAELEDCKRREIKYFSAVAINEMTEPFPTHDLNIRKPEYLEALEISKKLLSQNEALLSKNKELSHQYAKLSTELKNKTRQLASEISSNGSAKERETGLLNDIDSLEKDIKWYVETYANRSLVGVIRQKLTDSRLMRRKNRPGIYPLIPGSHILHDEEKQQYSIIGDDPYFHIDLNKENLPAGWYWLCIEIDPVAGKFISPKIYFDPGNGFNETNICYLPSPKNGKIISLVNFYDRVYGLRFDPSVSDCSFTVGNFSLKKISKFKALNKAVRIYRESLPGKSNGSIIQELFSKFKVHGISGVREHLRNMSQANIKNKITPYMQWCSRYDTLAPSEFELLRERSKKLVRRPLLSIVMPVYNPPIIYLQKAIDSVLIQPYFNWELCIADDCSTNQEVKKILTEYQEKDNRIKVVYRRQNGHISEASNSALQIAEGEFIVLLDQDDQLNTYALYLVAEAINRNPGAALLYSDEDKIDEEDNRFDPYFKSGWNPDLVMGQNMISHLGVYKKSIVKEIGGFRKGFEGSQDYDLALRFIQKIKPSQIIHIPHVLYHWRAISGSTAVSTDNKEYAYTAGLNALKSFIENQNLGAEVLANKNYSYRVKWNLTSLPKVSIVIPTRDKAEVLSLCAESILKKTMYPDYEIVIVDNNSTEQQAIELFSYLSKKDARVIVTQYNKPFNFSAIINYGVSKSTGDILVILNNDTEVINGDWLEELVAHTMRNNVGAVGAKLLYPNGAIQHAGVILYENHPGIHIYQGKKGDDPGYFNKLNLIQNYSAVTAACMAVRKKVYESVGGLDEENLPIAYNDVDFCLKLREKGFYNVWTPFSMLYHHESLSRGDDLDEKNIERFKKEHTYMLRKWQKFINNDSYFNPNLSPETRVTSYASPPKVLFSWRRNDFYQDQHRDRTHKHEPVIIE